MRKTKVNNTESWLITKHRHQLHLDIFLEEIVIHIRGANEFNQDTKIVFWRFFFINCAYFME